MTTEADFSGSRQIKKALCAPVYEKGNPLGRPRAAGRPEDLSDLVLSDLLELPLNVLHLIFEAEFQLLQAHFFQFFVVR